jgi:alkanesulfonate monooxygenase SsuD/methylene tetrahydromethanopterin reductase-like flavin-dependent oxidoreductase (luciferase family)
VTSIDIQLSAANSDWPTLRTVAREAEARGYGAVWVLDHLAGLPLGGTTMIEAFTLLGALAASTDEIELGTLVANVRNREPGTLVSAIASVALIADRQVHFGIGAGAAPGSAWAREQDLVGTRLEPDLAERHARVARVLDLADQQWAVDRDERWSSFPLPRLRPTTIVGVNSPALVRLAVERADGINILWFHPRREEHMAACESVLGDRPFVRTTLAHYSPDMLDPDHSERRAMSAFGFNRIVLDVMSDVRAWLDDEHPAASSPSRPARDV